MGSTTVELRAPAKLTLSLRITGVRADGYHLLDAEMVTVDLADTLVLTPLDEPVSARVAGGAVEGSDAAGGDPLEVVEAATGLPVVTGEDNTVRRALALARRRAVGRLVKRIPAGAGLGGGSADAAAVLRWCGVSDLAAAATLGADVPFCLVGGRARVRGVGEIVEPLPFEDRTFTLLIPPFGCSTPAVYEAWDGLRGSGATGGGVGAATGGSGRGGDISGAGSRDHGSESSAGGGVSGTDTGGGTHDGGSTHDGGGTEASRASSEPGAAQTAAIGPNDLETAALDVEPRLAEWRDRLAAATGERPRLAGSGSTWFVEGAHPGDGRVVVRTCR